MLQRLRDSIWAPSQLGDAVDEEELRELKELFEARCQEHSDRYDFTLCIKQAYKVASEVQQFHQERIGGFRESLRRQGMQDNGELLFHGTARPNVEQILRDGFVLPSSSGMFGKGIYFARCPLKSWQYCRGGCAMLLCDVELGRPKVKRAAAPGLAPERDFTRSWLMQCLGRQRFDSVMAKDCVRVPELVVYRPEQAAPRYVLILDSQPSRKVRHLSIGLDEVENGSEYDSCNEN